MEVLSLTNRMALPLIAGRETSRLLSPKGSCRKLVEVAAQEQVECRLSDFYLIRIGCMYIGANYDVFPAVWYQRSDAKVIGSRRRRIDRASPESTTTISSFA